MGSWRREKCRLPCLCFRHNLLIKYVVNPQECECYLKWSLLSLHNVIYDALWLQCEACEYVLVPCYSCWCTFWEQSCWRRIVETRASVGFLKRGLEILKYSSCKREPGSPWVWVWPLGQKAQCHSILQFRLNNGNYSIPTSLTRENRHRCYVGIAWHNVSA